MKKKLPKSLRKFIRREKARIRREVLDLKEQEVLIQKLYQKVANQFIKKLEIKNNVIEKVS
jgi:outer membrane lipopolysaccharide assembly protein LptE/RlpB